MGSASAAYLWKNNGQVHVQKGQILKTLELAKKNQEKQNSSEVISMISTSRVWLQSNKHEHMCFLDICIELFEVRDIEYNIEYISKDVM